ncbi:unnamed protein product [Brassicogethes aeneus]|uniref:Uncharacterized protein n=1 Tax=Brassicogethes aeneus TaxID=1431903 RepID=A0A9P0B782_BRAAE|nr:unnamed protein product [Brassicogethes aeneus]
MGEKESTSPLKPAPIPPGGLFFPDFNVTAFDKSRKIIRTPTKVNKPLPAPNVKSAPKVSKKHKKEKDKELDKSNTASNNSLERAKSDLSPNIKSKINQLFNAGDEKHQKTQNHGPMPSPEEMRLQRENARLVGMVESLTAQLSTQSAQITALQRQIEILNANFLTLKGTELGKASSNLAIDIDNDSPEKPSKRKRNNSLPSSPKLSTAPMEENAHSSTQNDPHDASVDFPPLPAKEPPLAPAYILRNKSRWTMVSGAITAAGHTFSRATNIHDGVKIFPDSSNDYRAITKFLTENGEEYHTYQLPEERMVQAVIRGLPLEIDIKDIKNDLIEHNYHPSTVIRMHSSQLNTTGSNYRPPTPTRPNNPVSPLIFPTQQIAGSTYRPPTPILQSVASSSHSNQAAPAAATSNDDTSPKIPPIILRIKKRWPNISNEFSLRGWHFHKVSDFTPLPSTATAKSLPSLQPTKSNFTHTYFPRNACFRSL